MEDGLTKVVDHNWIGELAAKKRPALKMYTMIGRSYFLRNWDPFFLAPPTRCHA